MFKDSIKDDPPRRRLDEVLAFARLKVEKLAVATYRVTDIVAQSEPLRGSLRSCTVKALISIENESSGGDTLYLLRRLSLLCNLAVDARIGSQMNFGILSEEYSSLANLLDKEVLGTIINETQGGVLPTHSVSVAIPQTKSYKGHIKDIKDNTLHIHASGRVERIIAYIREHQSSAIKEVAALFPGISEKTIQRELLALVGKGILAKHGERRWSTYSLRHGESS